MFHCFKQKTFRILAISSLLFFTSGTNTPSQTWYASGDGGAFAGGGTMKSADAGIEMLKDKGGTAADAAAATLLVLTLEDNGLFCMGGEVPFIYFEAATGEIKVLSGQGRAPLDSQALDWLIANGIPDPDASDNIKTMSSHEWPRFHPATIQNSTFRRLNFIYPSDPAPFDYAPFGYAHGGQGRPFDFAQGRRENPTGSTI